MVPFKRHYRNICELKMKNSAFNNVYKISVFYLFIFHSARSIKKAKKLCFETNSAASLNYTFFEFKPTVCETIDVL